MKYTRLLILILMSSFQAFAMDENTTQPQRQNLPFKFYYLNHDANKEMALLLSITGTSLWRWGETGIWANHAHHMRSEQEKHGYPKPSWNKFEMPQSLKMARNLNRASLLCLGLYLLFEVKTFENSKEN